MTDHPKLTDAQQQEIEDRFRNRLQKAHGIDPASKAATGKRALLLEQEFFTGAMAAAQAILGSPAAPDSPAFPPIWPICILSGRSILAFRERQRKDAPIVAAAASPARPETRSACDACGAEVESVVGCPDGRELCQDCFDQGNG